MKTAILIHGTCDKDEYFSEEYPSLSNSHWFPWLQKQLLMKGVATATPDMLNAYQPDYKIWKKELERFDITPETVLVGHSCGGGFLVRWLSENKEVKVGKVVLVAPWLDPNKKKDPNFFDFTFDSDLVSRTSGVTIFNSDDDNEAINVSVQKIVDNVDGVKLVNFKNYGHFCLINMGTEKFPELLEEVLS